MRYILATALLAMALPVLGARHVQVDIAPDYASPPVVDTLVGAEYLVAGVNGDGALQMQRIRLTSAGWTALPPVVSEVSLAPGWHVADLFAFQSANGGFVLLEQKECDEQGGNCVVISRELGRVSSNLVGYERWASPAACEGKAVLNSNTQWAALTDGCGNVTVYDSPDSILAQATVPAAALVSALPVVQDNALAPIQFATFSSSQYQTFTLNQDESDFSFGWERESTTITGDYNDADCLLTAHPQAPLLCLSDDGVLTQVGLDGQTVTVEALQKEDEPYRELLSAYTDVDRIFVWERATEVIEEEEEGEEIEVTSLIINNVSVDDNVILNTHDTEKNSDGDPSVRLSRNNAHGISVFSAKEDGFVASLYMFLNVDQPPLFKELTGVNVMTETTEVQTLILADEESPASTLTLSATDLPDFAVLEPSARTLTYTPTHEQAGQYTAGVTATDPEGNTQDTSIPVNVILTPYQWLVFEPVIFGQLEEEAPLPVEPVFSALVNWPLMEDETVTLQFSWANREHDDVTVVFESLPDFMVYNDAADTLVITPEQADVGRHTLSAILRDRYAPEDAEPDTITLRFEVIEVDDPLVITSDGSARVNVGDEYRYTLTFEDEESEASELRVDIAEAPDFLTFDAQTMTLSGTPEQDDAGPNEVKMLISDRGGNRVLHQFEIAVVSTQNDVEKEGGSMTWAWLAALFTVAGFRRRGRLF